MILAKDLIKLSIQVSHNDYYQIYLISNISKTKKMNHKSFTWESIQYDVKFFQHRRCFNFSERDIMYLKLTFLFLTGLGFVGTTNKLVLIEHQVSSHFISFKDCSFVFTVALKKKGLESMDMISNWKKQKKKNSLPLYIKAILYGRHFINWSHWFRTKINIWNEDGMSCWKITKFQNFDKKRKILKKTLHPTPKLCTMAITTYCYLSLQRTVTIVKDVQTI